MGAFWSYTRNVNVLLLGLGVAGKTTIFNKITRPEETINTFATIGFNLESININNINVILWDVGGGMNINRVLAKSYGGFESIIFVIDSDDKESVAEAREELYKILQISQLEDSTLLVFANKSDRSTCMSVSEITDKLHLTELKDRNWFVQACSGTTGAGLGDGFAWLLNNI